MKQPQTPWLSVIGIGEDGLDCLGDLAWSLIAQAKVIYGGARHLAMLPDVMICDAEKRGDGHNHSLMPLTSWMRCAVRP